MNKWVQLKDGVAFAVVESEGIVENSILISNELNWSDVRAKTYQNGSWVEAPLIYFVTQLIGNVVYQINSTVFSSDVTGDVVSVECQLGWIKNDNGTYTEPPVVTVPEPIPVPNNN